MYLLHKQQQKNWRKVRNQWKRERAWRERTGEFRRRRSRTQTTVHTDASVSTCTLSLNTPSDTVSTNMSREGFVLSEIRMCTKLHSFYFHRQVQFGEFKFNFIFNTHEIFNLSFVFLPTTFDWRLQFTVIHNNKWHSFKDHFLCF